MKLHDVLEGDVIDLGARRAKKGVDHITSALRKIKDDDLPQHYEFEKQAQNELHHFEQWMQNVKQKSRLPGFDNIDEVSFYLVIDLNIPTWTPRKPSPRGDPKSGAHIAHVGEVEQQQKKIRQWYSGLKAEDKKKFQMIVHHLPRMRKALETIRNELDKFINKWDEMFKKKMFHTKLDAQGATTYLDTEIWRDLDELKRVEDIAHIIGLL